MGFSDAFLRGATAINNARELRMREEQFEKRRADEIRENDRRAEHWLRAFEENKRQFDDAAARNVDQFGKNLAEQVRQHNNQMELGRDQLSSLDAYRRESLNQSKAAADYARQLDELKIAGSSFQAGLENVVARYGGDLNSAFTDPAAQKLVLGAANHPLLKPYVGLGKEIESFHDNGNGTWTPMVRTVTEDGKSYLAPMTANRSSAEDDPVVMFTPDQLIGMVGAAAARGAPGVFGVVNKGLEARGAVESTAALTGGGLGAGSPGASGEGSAPGAVGGGPAASSGGPAPVPNPLDEAGDSMPLPQPTVPQGAPSTSAPVPGTAQGPEEAYKSQPVPPGESVPIPESMLKGPPRPETLDQAQSFVSQNFSALTRDPVAKQVGLVEAMQPFFSGKTQSGRVVREIRGDSMTEEGRVDINSALDRYWDIKSKQTLATSERGARARRSIHAGARGVPPGPQPAEVTAEQSGNVREVGPSTTPPSSPAFKSAPSMEQLRDGDISSVPAMSGQAVASAANELSDSKPATANQRKALANLLRIGAISHEQLRSYMETGHFPYKVNHSDGVIYSVNEAGEVVSVRTMPDPAKQNKLRADRAKYVGDQWDSLIKHLNGFLSDMAPHKGDKPLPSYGSGVMLSDMQEAANDTFLKDKFGFGADNLWRLASNPTLTAKLAEMWVDSRKSSKDSSFFRSAVKWSLADVYARDYAPSHYTEDGALIVSAGGRTWTVQNPRLEAGKLGIPSPERLSEEELIQELGKVLSKK